MVACCSSKDESIGLWTEEFDGLRMDEWEKSAVNVDRKKHAGDNMEWEVDNY